MTGTEQIYIHKKEKKIAATVVERDTKKKKTVIVTIAFSWWLSALCASNFRIDSISLLSIWSQINIHMIKQKEKKTVKIMHITTFCKRKTKFPHMHCINSASSYSAPAANQQRPHNKDKANAKPKWHNKVTTTRAKKEAQHTKRKKNEIKK